MKVSTQQKSNVAEELKRGEKEKQGNRVACRKLARRLHQDDGNQRNKRWRDACFFPPAIPSPSRSLVPTPSIYLSVPDFLQSIIQEEIVQIPLLPAIVDKSTPIHQRNRPNPSTPQLQFDKSILNPSSPSKESYPSSAQEGNGGQVRPPVEL